MIWRASLLAACATLTYLLLRGWPEGLPPVARLCAAVLALVTGLVVWSPPARSGEAAVVTRPPDRFDLLALAGGLAAAVCALLWLWFAAPAPLESLALEVERRFRPEASAMRSLSSARNDAPVAGNWLWNEESRRPLPRRADFRPGTKPEVFLRIGNPADVSRLLGGRVYVTAFALGRYADSTWGTLPEPGRLLVADESGFVRLNADAKPEREILHEVFHAADPGRRSPLTTLHGATAAAISPLERVDDGLFLLPEPNESVGYRYLARAAGLRLDELPDTGLISPRAEVPAEFLDVPSRPAYRGLVTMARTAAGSGSIKDQLRRLEQHLRETYQYSLEILNPDDLDPMENFFFGENRGHCEYFATAGALMARSLGIPARIAYGWAGGTWYEASDLFVFRANEAHAWTEVWLENHGWVVIDPTPPAGGSDRARVAPPGERPPIAGDDENEESAGSETALWAADARLPTGLFGVALVVAAAAVMLRGRRHRESPALPGPGGFDDAPGYLGAWRGACAANGTAVRPGATLKHQLRSMTGVPDFAAEMVAYHYAVRYEGGTADPAFEKHLVRRIRGWRRSFSGIKQPPETSQQSR